MKQKILSDAAESRRNEVMMHQINIDNYRLAIAEIETNYADDPDLVEFKSRLQDLLRSSLIEQRKEQIMLTVIEKQLERE